MAAAQSRRGVATEAAAAARSITAAEEAHQQARAALRLQSQARGHLGRARAAAIAEQRAEEERAVVAEALAAVESSEESAVRRIQSAVRAHKAVRRTREALQEGKMSKKRSKRFGWLLGLQSKELALRDDALVYAKAGKAKGKTLALQAMQACGPLASKGPLAWSVRMHDGHVYEFHAATPEARDVWVRAINDKIQAFRTKSFVGVVSAASKSLGRRAADARAPATPSAAAPTQSYIAS